MDWRINDLVQVPNVIAGHDYAIGIILKIEVDYAFIILGIVNPSKNKVIKVKLDTLLPFTGYGK